MVFGLKEILKLAKVERLKCVLIATNVEDINFQGEIWVWRISLLASSVYQLFVYRWP